MPTWNAQLQAGFVLSDSTLIPPTHLERDPFREIWIEGASGGGGNERCVPRRPKGRA
jgi:hypothetical protein